ncbi:S-adenosyl-L-methionine-dependent methyltransferase [Xylariaceae sp. FL0804]|nr:S-adenosyl-L-methionine-dependent methyltransferase [Xylariaceae sp. FL0804]
MAQNIYDDPAFLAEFRALTRAENGDSAVYQAADGVPDPLALASLLPPLRGAHVLDLGCGDGWFARWVAAQGAASVHGVDLARTMVARARELSTTGGSSSSSSSSSGGSINSSSNSSNSSNDSGNGSGDGSGDNHQGTETETTMTFAVADLNSPAGALLPGRPAHALALHYLTDLAALFAEVRAVLRPGGAFVLSAEHPMRTATRRPGVLAYADDADADAEESGDDDEQRDEEEEDDEKEEEEEEQKKKRRIGRRKTTTTNQKDEQKQKKKKLFWPVSDYLDEGERVTNWLLPGVVKQHHTLGTYLRGLLACGFEIVHFDEWCQRRDGPGHRYAGSAWLIPEDVMPAYMLIGARKK